MEHKGSVKGITVRMIEPDEPKTDEPQERTAEVLLYDVIGEDMFGGVSAKGFSEELAALGELDLIIVRINSPGGDAFDGNAIYNALVRHPARVRVEVDGIAASAASYVAMSGDEIIMAKNAMMMIHLGQGGARGDKRIMLKVAEVLDKLDNEIADIYADRTGRKPATFLRMMADETWFNAEEAVAAKLADSITENKKHKRHAGNFSREVLNKLWQDETRIAAFAEDVPELPALGTKWTVSTWYTEDGKLVATGVQPDDTTLAVTSNSAITPATKPASESTTVSERKTPYLTESEEVQYDEYVAKQKADVEARRQKVNEEWSPVAV